MMAAGRFDQRLLVLVTLGLVAFGLVMVYSATSASEALGDGDSMSYLKRQAVYALIGVIVMAVASRFDYHRLRYIAPPLLLVALGLCVAVLVAGSCSDPRAFSPRSSPSSRSACLRRSTSHAGDRRGPFASSARSGCSRPSSAG
jgi:Cell cycle protein